MKSHRGSLDTEVLSALKQNALTDGDGAKNSNIVTGTVISGEKKNSVVHSKAPGTKEATTSVPSSIDSVPKDSGNSKSLLNMYTNSMNMMTPVQWQQMQLAALRRNMEGGVQADPGNLANTQVNNPMVGLLQQPQSTSMDYNNINLLFKKQMEAANGGMSLPWYNPASFGRPPGASGQKKGTKRKLQKKTDNAFSSSAFNGDDYAVSGSSKSDLAAGNNNRSDKKYRSGRWKPEEHALFVEGLELYGKEWKKIATKVKTRTLVQIRTHAQKYFLKQEKDRECDDLDSSSFDESPTGLKSKQRRKGNLGRRKKGDGASTFSNSDDTNARSPSMDDTDSDRKNSESQDAMSASGKKMMGTGSAKLGRSKGRGRGRGRGRARGKGKYRRRNKTASSRLPLPFSNQLTYQHSQAAASAAAASLLGIPNVSQVPAQFLSYGKSATIQQKHKLQSVSTPGVLPGSEVPNGGKVLGYRSPRKVDKNMDLRITKPKDFTVNVPPLGTPGTPVTTAAKGRTKLHRAVLSEDVERVSKLLGVSPNWTVAQLVLSPEEKAEREKEKEDTKKGSLEVVPKQESEGKKDGEISMEVKGNKETKENKSGMAEKSASPKMENTVVQKEAAEMPASMEISSPPKTSEEESTRIVTKDSKTPESSSDVSKAVPPPPLPDSSKTPPVASKASITTNSPPTSAPALASADKTSIWSHSSPSKPGIIAPTRTSPFPHHVKDKGEVLSAKGEKAGNDKIAKPVQNLSPSKKHSDIDSTDTHGFTPLMIAASLDHTKTNRGLIIVDMLIRSGADVEKSDEKGYTATHWAAALDSCKVLRYLVSIANSNVNALSKDLETPLHRASRLGRITAVCALLKEFNANYRLRNKDYRSAWDVAGMFTTHVATKVCVKVRREFQKNSEFFRTLVLHHEDCLDHTPRLQGGSQGQYPWESPDRITAIMSSLQDDFVFPSKNELAFSALFPSAGFRQLQRVHSSQYIQFVYNLSKMVQLQNNPVPFTPKVQRSLRGADPDEVKDATVSDTSFSKGSLAAALRAAGSVCHAIDRVVSGKYQNSFCCIRPPGHHAGVNGLLQDAESCGFCIFNNIAIGALHALAEHGDIIKRVAILDFDVHHGNGTEEIIRNFSDSDKILFVSVHLYLKDESFEFYPGSGETDHITSNIINVPLEPIWKARENVRRERAEYRDARRQGSMRNYRSDRYGRPKPGHSQFMQQCEQRMLPAVRAFNPDLILISAGFDAGKNDVGNGKHAPKYAGGMDMQPEDYAELTEKIQRIAGICCDGRIVSVLEGGYGRYGRRQSQIDRTSMAQMATAHVGVLAGLQRKWEDVPEIGARSREQDKKSEELEEKAARKARRKRKREEKAARKARRQALLEKEKKEREEKAIAQKLENEEKESSKDSENDKQSSRKSSRKRKLTVKAVEERAAAEKKKNSPKISPSKGGNSLSCDNESSSELSSSDSNDEAENTNISPQFFCSCQCTEDDDRFMIECSRGLRCNGWVHPECVGLNISEEEALKLDKFICSWCLASEGPASVALLTATPDSQRPNSNPDFSRTGTPKTRARLGSMSLGLPRLPLSAAAEEGITGRRRSTSHGGGSPSKYHGISSSSGRTLRGGLRQTSSEVLSNNSAFLNNTQVTISPESSNNSDRSKESETVNVNLDKDSTSMNEKTALCSLSANSTKESITGCAKRKREESDLTNHEVTKKPKAN